AAPVSWLTLILPNSFAGKSRPRHELLFFGAIIPFEGRGENKLRGGEGCCRIEFRDFSAGCFLIAVRPSVRAKEPSLSRYVSSRPISRSPSRTHPEQPRAEGIAAKTSRGPGWRRRRGQSRGTVLRADTSK